MVSSGRRSHTLADISLEFQLMDQRCIKVVHRTEARVPGLQEEVSVIVQHTDDGATARGG